MERPAGTLAMPLESFYQAANRLARAMRQFPWYHRTSVSERINGIRSDVVLVVWVEGGPHDEIPKTWDGWKVVVRRVSRKHPCPFGSVKRKKK